jgi:hypothetical protein
MLIVDVVLCFLLIAFLRPGGCKPTAIRHATLLYPVLLSHDIVVPFLLKTTTFPYDSASSLSLSLNRTTVSHQSGSRKPQDLVSVLTALERP